MEMMLRISEGDREFLKDEIQRIIKEELKNHVIISNKEVEKNDYMTIDEATKFLGCSKVTLYHYRKSGQIDYYQVGRKIFVKKNELLKKVRLESKRRSRFS